MASQQPVGVLGAGSWGTALAILIARNGHRVWLWSHSGQQASDIAQQRENSRYLPGITLPDTIDVAADLASLVRNTFGLVIAVPSHAFHNTLVSVRQHAEGPLRVCWGTKGFEPNSGRLPSAVFHEVLNTHDTVPAVISGPSFANEVALGFPTALTVGCEDDAATQQFTDWFRNERVRVYTSTDLVGIQLGGAIKNVMAIATGICDGLSLGANARAALITRALAEMTRFGIALGGQAKTFSGLTGVGDLLLTATDDQSRNRRLGIGLGGGSSINKLIKEIGQEIEGINTARVLYEKSRELGIQMPISEQVYRVIFNDLDPASAVTTLLGRAPREETD